MWHKDPVIKIPLVKSASSNRIEMEFVDWPRISDIIEDQANFKQAVGEIARFFFQSILKGGMVHGDISLFNALVCPSGKRVCILDFGLCIKLEPQLIHRTLFEEPEEGPQKMAFQAWTTKGFRFNMKWWNSFQSSLLYCSGNDLSGVYVRSVVSLCKMASMAGFVVNEDFRL